MYSGSPGYYLTRELPTEQAQVGKTTYFHLYSDHLTIEPSFYIPSTFLTALNVPKIKVFLRMTLKQQICDPTVTCFNQSLVRALPYV
jgi:hypothetical protein